MKKKWIAPAAAGLLPLIPFGALAQDVPAEGQFSINYTAVNPSPIKPLSL